MFFIHGIFQVLHLDIFRYHAFVNNTRTVDKYLLIIFSFNTSIMRLVIILNLTKCTLRLR